MSRTVSANVVPWNQAQMDFSVGWNAPGCRCTELLGLAISSIGNPATYNKGFAVQDW